MGTADQTCRYPEDEVKGTNMLKGIFADILKSQLLPLLKPFLTALVTKVMEKVFTYVNDQVTAGTLTLTNGVPQNLVDETVNELLA